MHRYMCVYIYVCVYVYTLTKEYFEIRENTKADVIEITNKT